MNVTANPLSSTKPLLACQNYETSIQTFENTYFNLTFIIVDQISKLQMPNISFNV